MKQGKTLTQLAQELERRKTLGKDFMADAGRIEAITLHVPTEQDNERQEIRIALQNGEKKLFKPTPWAHGQMATYAEVPKAYYDRLIGENPLLLADNINHGIERQVAKATKEKRREQRMIRTVGGEMIANLSSRFRRLDCADMAEAVLPDILEGGFSVESCEITDKRLYIRALSPKIAGEIMKGDPVQFGVTVSNSDVGAGSAQIETFSYRLICKNGMKGWASHGARHVGRNLATGEDVAELLTDRTKEVSDAAFWLSIRDVVRATMTGKGFEKDIEKLREAAGVKITNFNLQEVVELAMDRVKVTGEKTKESMLAYLANGADGAGLTKWGLANAFTWAAQADHVDYDDSMALERAGSAVIELAPKDWARIAEKAA